MSIPRSVSDIRGLLPRPTLPVRCHGDRVACGTAADGVRTESSKTPWWLWWNLLSVDAPTVAVVWATVFAHASGARLSAAEVTVLAFAVWVIYASDRLLDGWTARDRAALQERHHFCERHRLVLGGLVVLATAAMVWLTADHLPLAEITAGVKLGALVVLYMASTHAGRGRMAWVVPKEIAVGLLFAAGVTLPLWSPRVLLAWEAFLPWLLFGLLCALNCLSIECWENHIRNGEWRQPPHTLLRWADSHIHWIAAALGMAALTACLLRDPGGSSVAALLGIFLGALVLMLLNWSRAKLWPAALRVLADGALLVPAIIALVVRG